MGDPSDEAEEDLRIEETEGKMVWLRNTQKKVNPSTMRVCSPKGLPTRAVWAQESGHGVRKEACCGWRLEVPCSRGDEADRYIKMSTRAGKKGEE